MSSFRYAYDTTGVSTYFALALLVLILIPFSLSFKPSQVQIIKCACFKCKMKPIKKQPRISFKLICLSFGWLLALYLAYVASSLIIDDILWDPYLILGLDKSATTKDIKVAFKSLAKIWHPDKVSDKDKEKAHDMYTQLSKAYKTLTKEDARAIWEEFGDPDAASLGIALPAWLVKKENNLLVLLIYTLIFGVALPYWVASWWYQSKSLTRDKILHSTMGFFYKEVHEKIGPKGILEIISAAQEFNSIPDFNEKDIQDLALVVKKTLDERYKGTIIDKSKKYPPKSYQILLLLHSHLLRIELPQSQTLIRDSIIEKAIDLIKGVLQITVSRNWLQASTTTLELSQNMIQALYFSQSQLSQLPNLDATILKHFVTKKRNIDSISSFLELNDEECDSLLRSFTVEDIAIVKHVAKLYPVLRIVGAKFKVLGEAAVIPSSIVTFIVKLKLNEIVTEDDAIVDEDFEEEERKWWIPSQKADYVHAPYYPTEKTPYWWVFLGDQRSNRLINVTKTTFTKSTAIARIQFQAPQTSGKWNFTVFVKSDCVVGCDVSIPVELVVEKAELHPVEDYDDDISEPDLDSFAGQLQAVKKVKQEYDDSSDEDDVGGAREAPHDHSDPNHHH